MAIPVPKIQGPAQTPAKQPMTDLSAYPILTEEVGYSPSPLARKSGPSFGGGGSGSSGSDLGNLVSRAVSEVLGWKMKPGDTKGFVGALTQSFSLKESEGHVNATWTPRTYAVQTDLNGGISGAQASVYARGKDAIESSLPLLDGLYALDPEAAPEDVLALKAVAKSQLGELVNELGMLPPRVGRVNQYFGLLLGDNTFPPSATANSMLSATDPDLIGGTLGNLRDELGLNFTTQDFVNSVEDETDLSNFRVVSDYITSLAQSWLNNVGFLVLTTKTPFFGTQLVLLSRQLMVVAESVDEVRFTLDSVFVGPSERQTMQLNFPAASPPIPAIFLEDMLSWIQNFASEEGPRLIQDGGKFAVQNTFYPVSTKLLNMVKNLPGNPGLAPGFYTPRVQLSIGDLQKQLQELARLAKPIEHVITPEPNFGLPFELSGVDPATLTVSQVPGTFGYVTVRGNGFQVNAAINFTPAIAGVTTLFRSETLLVAQIPKVNLPAANTRYTITVTNADSTLSSPLTNSLTVNP